MDQEPQMLAAKSQRISERGGTKGGGGGGTADGYGSEAEQQMDKNAGWDEGTCWQPFVRVVPNFAVMRSDASLLTRKVVRRKPPPSRS